MDRGMQVRLCAVPALVGLLCGCASTRQTVPLPTGPIAAGQARIEVFRPNRVVACACPIVIADGGTRIGEVGPGGKLVWDRPAGAMVLTPFNDKESFSVGRGLPMRVGVGDGSAYRLSVSVSRLRSIPKLELVAGTPAVMVEKETHTTSAAVESSQQPLPTAGEGHSFTGTIRRKGLTNPLWYGRNVLAIVEAIDDTGGKAEFLIFDTSTITGADGKKAGLTTNRRAQIKYSGVTEGYPRAVGKKKVVSMRYLD